MSQCNAMKMKSCGGVSLNTIYNENCLLTLKRIPDNFLDLTITSPPYNVDLGNNKYNTFGYDEYDDNLKYEDYLEFLKKVFEGVYKKTKDGGRCCINIGDGKNGKIPTHSDIIYFMTRELKWLPFTTIIWSKKHTSNRTAWGSWLSPSSPSFPRCFEYILVFAKNSLKLKNKGITDLHRDEFIAWSNPEWVFAPKTRKTTHPAPFPIELPKRCVKLFSWVNSVVYDPFMGSGTTAIACLLYNRYYIGSEKSKKHYNDSLSDISKASVQLQFVGGEIKHDS